MALRRGEKGMLAFIAAIILIYMGGKLYYIEFHPIKDRGIPFYSTASHDVARRATDLIRREGCRDCHTLWATQNMTQFVPSPPLDGIGSLRSKKWLYQYFSAKDPQAILPSRLKPKYRMPSYANLPESERQLLATYMASLKVKDWYLEEVKKKEYEKLTGHPMVDSGTDTSR
ncbi:MAG TPA: c-type cytochrome [Mariprofundaceae bacterium]|nr:c-type cytochrome [Mariprofundaceae bacterium]